MNTFLHDTLEYWKAGGLLLIPIALVCFGIWAFFFKSRRALLDTLTLPDDTLGQLGEHHLTLLRRDFMILAAFTTAAPLLGLLGTVLGMIGTFDAVAGAGVHTTDRVAGGISQALITTQFGLLVAIPGVFGLARLKRLFDQVAVRFAANPVRAFKEASA